MVVTSKRLTFINDAGFLTSMPVCVFMQPINSIISVGIGLPRLPLAKKILIITYKEDEALYTIDIRTDIEPEKVKSYIERILRENATLNLASEGQSPLSLRTLDMVIVEICLTKSDSSPPDQGR